MNTNLLHNILNIAIVVVAGLSAFDWSAIIDPALAIKIVGALSMAKLLMNAVRDGLPGMVRPQPPVQ